MSRVARYFMQLILYAAFAVFVAWFATEPRYRYADSSMASVKVSLSHAADRVKPCVPLSPEEIAELAANMRRSETCERERLPVILEMDVDGERVIELSAPASGLWNDGPASIYERFDLLPGEHRISVRLRDTARAEGWDYERSGVVTLEAGRYFTVTFKAETGGFNFR